MTLPAHAGDVDTLLGAIAAGMPELRPSEQKVAALVLADPIGALDHNMAGLADAAGVSEPTVMRFCSAIGFDGFRTFKIALAQAVAVGLPIAHSGLDRHDSPAQLAEKIFDHSIASLDRARRRLDPAALDRAVGLLAGASSLIFVGFGASGIIAQDAQQKFPLFGVPCDAPADFHQQFIAVSMSTPRTVTVAISHTGHTAETVRIAAAAREAGGRVVTITGDDGPLSSYADVDIRLSTFEDTDMFTPTVSRLAGLVVVDVLATAVALRSSEAHLRRVRAMKDALARMRDVEQEQDEERSA
ncbi:SIS domain-containing protein [Amnibacterium sp.]|uniref:SIS domain-containing protein n=1 Tax=Amnibacterium sp. TaxID=1872496 RepID=UPI0026357371|nr:SIS domain-containing protein [Amnibacterium sp.]MCU1474809.1 transcriptional regulator [Amnibacterium sp.]